MGKFDNEDKKKSKIPTIAFFLIAMFLIGTIMMMFGGSDNRPMCDEVIELMLSDSDHERLHETYPITMSQLHNYMDENCDTIDEDNRFLINP